MKRSTVGPFAHIEKNHRDVRQLSLRRLIRTNALQLAMHTKGKSVAIGMIILAIGICFIEFLGTPAVPISDGQIRNQLLSSSVPTGDVHEKKNSSDCWLIPAWGSHSSVPSAAITATTTATACVGPRPKQPYTTATQLTCPDNAQNHLVSGGKHPTGGKGLRGINGDGEDFHHGYTIVLLYYAQPSMLMRHLQVLSSYPPKLQSQITLLIADDGSPVGLQAREYVLDENSRNSYSFRIRIARVTVDLAWNLAGVHNLGFYVADTQHVLLLDMDVFASEKTAQQLVQIEMTSWWGWRGLGRCHLVHKFNRIVPDGRQKIHPKCMFISKTVFWMNGGCDEDFVGNYGLDDIHFWHRFSLNKRRILTVRHRDVYLEPFELDACDKHYIESEEKHLQCIKSLGQLLQREKNNAINHRN